MKIAFCQFGALGDVLMATPALHVLRQNHPNDHITWIVFECYAKAVADNHDLDAVLAWKLDPGIPRVQQELRQWQQIKEHAKANFDLVVSPQCYPDHDWSKMPGVHLIDQMMIFSGQMPEKPRRIHMPGLSPPKPPRPGMKRHVALNIKCNTEVPVWTTDQWKSLIAGIQDRGFSPIIGDDPVMCDIPTWRNIVAGAACWFGYNSGGMWIAASTPTPQVVIGSQTPMCPDWLVGLREAKVKDDRLVSQLTNPGVDAALKAFDHLIEDSHGPVFNPFEHAEEMR